MGTEAATYSVEVIFTSCQSEDRLFKYRQPGGQADLREMIQSLKLHKWSFRVQH